MKLYDYLAKVCFRLAIYCEQETDHEIKDEINALIFSLDNIMDKIVASEDIPDQSNLPF